MVSEKRRHNKTKNERNMQVANKSGRPAPCHHEGFEVANNPRLSLSKITLSENALPNFIIKQYYKCHKYYQYYK
jgi:hypothetical protein